MSVPAAGRLTREARLRRRGDFAALRASQNRIGCRSFHARYLANDCGHARLGLAISKRVSSRAVERNRLKRLVRESFRRVWRQLPPVDILVMGRQQAAGVEGAELLAHLCDLWRKLQSVQRDQASAAPSH